MRAEQLNADGDPACVLVVDDSDASRQVVADCLRQGGHDVVEARTGDEALGLLAQRPIELVIVNVDLPDMSGFEVCERIKSDPRTATLPVIHISATATSPEDQAIGLARGADAYLTEPVDPNLLVATANTTLRWSRACEATERLAARLAVLTTSTLTLNTATTFDDLMRSSAAGAATIMDSPAIAMIVSAEGRHRLGSASGPGAEVRLRAAAQAWWGRFVNATLGQRAGARLTRLPPDAASFGDTELAGWVAVVVRRQPRRPGVCVAVPASAVRGDTDRDLLSQWGQATALATESLRVYTEEHRLALTLQDSLLPRLPDHPTLDMAARYVPAAANAEIGGDFYEVTELDGRLLVAIGDVSGHSITAATIMGEVQHAMRAYALEGHRPVAILDRLDAMLRRFHPTDGFTTLCLLSVDVDAGTVAIANAGHLPPLMVDDDAHYLDVTGPMLGLGLARPNETVVRLEPGATVVLFTDGLIERAGTVLDDSMAELREAVAPQPKRAPPALEDLCEALLARFGKGGTDDIALLTLRRKR